MVILARNALTKSCSLLAAERLPALAPVPVLVPVLALASIYIYIYIYILEVAHLAGWRTGWLV